MHCTICDIILKVQPAHIVYEDELWTAFLDHRPLFIGHCLLTPKIHYENIFELPDMMGSSLLTTAKRIGNAIKQAVDAQGLFIASNNAVSQSILHVHIHLVPRSKGDGLKGFFWPRLRYENDEHKRQVQIAISKFLI